MKCVPRSRRGKSVCPLSSPTTIPTTPTPHSAPECRPRVYIGWHIRWQKPFPPPGGHNTLIPRQFACAIAPDPIAFLLPTGHQRATHSAYRTSLGKTYWVGRSGERHDELARTVPTVHYFSRNDSPSPTYHYATIATAPSVRARHAR